MRNKILLILFLSVIMISVVDAQSETQIAVCSEQLEICIEGYNNLLEDFRNDINCRGTAFDSIKKNNINLSIDRDTYQNEVETLKNYRFGFYLLLVLFVIFMIMYFREIFMEKGPKLKDKKKK